MNKRDVNFIVSVKDVPDEFSDNEVRSVLADSIEAEQSSQRRIYFYNPERDKEYYCKVTIKKVQPNA